jgi:hypothetical protein
VVETESGTGVILDAHQRRAVKPFDSPFVPLDDHTGDLGVIEDVKDDGGGIANSSGVGGVGMDGNPYNDRLKSFLAVLLTTVENRAVFSAEYLRP